MANPFLPSPSHRNRSTGGGSMKAEGGFTEVCVVDIIMNPEHEYWDQFGGWDGMGTIFFKKINKENVSYETKNPQESTARPFFANQKYYDFTKILEKKSNIEFLLTEIERLN